MDLADILRAAREKIAAPESWGKGMRRHDRPPETCCAAEAIEACTPGIEYDGKVMRLRLGAYNAIVKAAGLDRGSAISAWNDAPERTHAEVIAAFDSAIATNAR